MDPLSIILPIDKVKTLHKLLEIAGLVHKMNVNLVDMKEKIAALPEKDIMQMRDLFSELIS
ncbi:MAG: hypothetical protein JWO03_898 [Bacteroidetes bacterium]|nr:hypothetical protein [Bacteroidota bacterium]